MPVHVKSKLEGYCRCQTMFSLKSQKFSDDHFKPQQLFELKRDPILRVTVRKESPKVESPKAKVQSPEGKK